jgi:hypothetical protein
MVIDPQTMETYFPYYLTQERKEGLAIELSKFSDGNIDYYTDKLPDDILQGDGWYGFEVINFADGARRKTVGVVLSNTCDISSENRRDLPVKIVFAPVIKLDRYKKILENSALTTEQIASKFAAIREQKVTTIFYLPANNALGGECIALLDDLHTMPAQAFQGNRRKLFTLGMAGFYLFLLKLSIHFCRFHEELPR